MFIEHTTNTTTFTPSDLTDSISCAHLFAEKLKRVRGERTFPPREETDNLVQRKGEEHEAAYLAQLKADASLNVVEIDVNNDDWTIPIEQTIAAINDPSVDVVFQAHLAKGNWRGRADFLERNLETKLFEVMDTKLARSVKPYMVLQLCIYSDALADVQGQLPDQMHIVLGNGNRETLKVSEFIHYYRAAKARLEERAALNGEAAETYPWPVAHCANCRLNEECESRRETDDHLSRVAGISRQQALKLEETGITTSAELASAVDSQRPATLAMASFDKLRRQARLQLLPEPGEFELLEPQPGKGFAMLPDPDPGDVFYDIEGDPLWDASGGLEYLHGLWFFEDGDTEPGDATFRPLWSHHRNEEREKFRELIDFFVERREQHPDMHIYHYAPYEVTALKRLAQQYGTREEEVDQFLRDGVLVDLYRVVAQSLQASVPNYSIKSMEKFYMGERTALVKKGDDSIAEYERWRKTGDQSILDEIGDYNEEDCLSTFLLRDWLLLRRDEAIDRWGREKVYAEIEEEDEEPTGELTPGQELAAERVRLIEKLTAAGDASRTSGELESADLFELTAELMQYHSREAKPDLWEMYHRFSMTEDELVIDKESIGELRLLDVADNPRPEKQSQAYKLSFPEQPYRLKVGQKPLDPGTGSIAGEILEINETERWLELKRGPSLSEVPLPTALVPPGPLETWETQNAIARFGKSLLEDPDGEAFSTLRQLIVRKQPIGGASLQRHELGEQVALPVVTEGTYLMVQGPPGTGKTYVGARMIVELIRAGKRVGVTATGHSAIHNLLDEIEDYAHKTGCPLDGIKKSSSTGGTGSTYESRHGLIRSSSKNGDVHGSGADLIAGTAWLFAREEWDDELDYMFVDEAGQMSLATTIAVGTAARSLVLLGDPAQLPQVRKGVHPGGSGASAMEHVLGEHQTVPEDMGLFLETTHRLQPEICAYISEAFYDSRLGPEEKTSLHVTADGAGLRFMPVEHEARSLESPEEAFAIATEIERLAAAGVALADVIVVAPYNAQVDMLRRHLPPEVRVGTVDKFQGQEAEVAFFSLTASSREDVPRGLEFLFSAERLNVAISRAKSLAYLVGSPGLVGSDARSVHEMRLANRICAFIELAEASNAS